ncbi:MAG: hypothetical protein ACO1NN_07745 [Sphingopyxis sp.]
MNVTPYVMGLPYRIGALERLLAWLANQDDTAFHSLSEIGAALR